MNGKKRFLCAVALVLLSGGDIFGAKKSVQNSAENAGYAEQVPAPGELAGAFMVRRPNATVVGFINAQYKNLSNKQSKRGRTAKNKFRTVGQKVLVGNLIEGLIAAKELEAAQKALDYYGQSDKDARYKKLEKKIADAKAGRLVDVAVEQELAVYGPLSEMETARADAQERYERRREGRGIMQDEALRREIEQAGAKQELAQEINPEEVSGMVQQFGITKDQLPALVESLKQKRREKGGSMGEQDFFGVLMEYNPALKQRMAEEEAERASEETRLVLYQAPGAQSARERGQEPFEMWALPAANVEQPAIIRAGVRGTDAYGRYIDEKGFVVEYSAPQQRN